MVSVVIMVVIICAAIVDKSGDSNDGVSKVCRASAAPSNYLVTLQDGQTLLVQGEGEDGGDGDGNDDTDDTCQRKRRGDYDRK